jgi:hypothetical protein
VTCGFEPNHDRDRRALGVVAMGYAIASLLLLGLCCYGVYWTGHMIIDALSWLS